EPADAPAKVGLEQERARSLERGRRRCAWGRAFGLEQRKRRNPGQLEARKQIVDAGVEHQGRAAEQQVAFRRLESDGIDHKYAAIGCIERGVLMLEHLREPLANVTAVAERLLLEQQ